MVDWDTFWALYPRKVAKAHAFKVWNRLTEDEQALALEAIPIHVKYWQLTNREVEHIPHPGSWLLGERWLDEIKLPQGSFEKANRAIQEARQASRVMEPMPEHLKRFTRART